MLLAAALMRSSAKSAGWREARRLAGRQFAGATNIGSDAAGLYAALKANKQSVLLKLQSLRQELAEWQELLETDGELAPVAEGKTAGKADGKEAKPLPTPLMAALKEAVQARETWETQVIVKNWEEQPNAPAAAAEASGFLKQMFLGGLGKGKGNRK
jgi:hypothetical protein